MIKNIIGKIYNYSLEEVMGERFGAYSKYIIQDRALPDVRDGLKPVQRRILYSMYKDKNTYDKKTKKSAKAVGLIMGSYHPHGDSSIYEAMVRLSQSWKNNTPMVDMQGNNGSIDGDPAAAMRYTEARLSKISNVLLRDIGKDSVMFSPTYDDELLEPSVLPANFPNLLVNGASGISAGYATNIPPHNLEEVIDATIKRIDNPNCKLEEITRIIKGPDFPTGGTLEGTSEIKRAYETGKGKVVLKSKYEVIETKGKKQIIISEIPYEIVKANLIKKIEDIRIDKKIEGISEVRDESDKDNLVRIVIDIKKDSNINLIINYLLKNTEMQINYNFNVVAIVNRRPKILGLIEILDSFISHQKSVILKRSEFDLNHALTRKHIVEGIIKALGILDEVIKTIRKSKNKLDAIENLIKDFNFSKLQSEAIVMMQLYKLTNTDVTLLEEELTDLLKIIEFLSTIIKDEKILKSVMKKELNNIKKEFGTARKTNIVDEITEIKIDETDMISKEDFIVIISHDGYVKKVSIRSYNMTEGETTGLKEEDYVEGYYKINNINTILLFTNLGNYLYLPVYNIPEFKYKEIGKHISSIIKVSDNEKIIKSIAVTDFDSNVNIIIFTKNGMVKRSCIKDYLITRNSKPIVTIKLKDDDEVVNVSRDKSEDIAIFTKNGYYVNFENKEIPLVGLKTSGVIGIRCKDDEVVSGISLDKTKEYLTVVTDKSTIKRIKTSDLNYTGRAKKGNTYIKSPKSKKYVVTNVFNNKFKDEIGLYIDKEFKYYKVSEFNIMDLSSIGSSVTKKTFDKVFVKSKFKIIENEETKIKSNASDSESDTSIEKEKITKNLSMEDFFDDFKL